MSYYPIRIFWPDSPDWPTQFYTYEERDEPMPTTLNLQTKRNREVAELDAKAARTGRKAQFTVETHLYTSEPCASLHISNELSGNYEQNQSAYLYLDEEDLKAMQDAVYNARVKLAKARSQAALTNPQPF